MKFKVFKISFELGEYTESTPLTPIPYKTKRL